MAKRLAFALLAALLLGASVHGCSDGSSGGPPPATGGSFDQATFDQATFE